MNDDIIIAVAAVVIIGAVIYGFIRKFKNGGTKGIVTETLVDEVQDIVKKEISDVLHNAGLATNYEVFKNYVIRSLLKKARDYFDNKGGKIDEVVDIIDDDRIVEAINTVINMSGIENEIKDAYDQLVNARLKEIDASEEEVEAENNKIETEDLSQYEEKKEIDESEDPVITVDKEE